VASAAPPRRDGLAARLAPDRARRLSAPTTAITSWIARFEPFADARALDARVRAIPGIVATGLFVGMAHTVLVGDEGRITSMTRP
jgi:hypothetical protein